VGVRLDAFAEMIARMLGSRIEVRLELKSTSALVEVDPTQLESALLNAAVNARDAMPNGGTLTLSTWDCELNGKAAVCIGIADSGTGIPSDKLARVFEPFFTTKEIGKGTGLGLSQIHGFAEQAGGRAEIQSAEGKGTTLHILLPRSEKPLAEIRKEARAVKLPRGLKVLLVEDNLQVRDFAAELLEDLHCEVVTAKDGNAALERLGSQQFDLVFSDVVMPGLNGIELAKEVAVRWPELPVLLATGYGGRLVEDDVRRFEVVQKPYDMTSLGRTIAAVLKYARKGAST